jgi:hypothetical protein
MTNVAYEIDTLDISLLAARDLSSYQYCFVKISADNTVDYATAGTDKIIGILQNKPAAAGAAARVRVFGASRLVAVDTSCTYGTWVTATNNGSYKGQGVATTTDKNVTPGIVIQGADTAHEVCVVLLNGPSSLSV